jgi:hypothetical protein
MMLALLETELMPWLQKACVGVGVATSRLSSHGHCHSPRGSVSHPCCEWAILQTRIRMFVFPLLTVRLTD